jgi:zinc finger-like protein
MPGPVSAIRFAHNAYRVEMSRIDEAVNDGLRSGELDFKAIGERVVFLRRMLKGHEIAEEEVLLPTVDERVPGTARIYEMDHEGVNGYLDRLEDAIASGDRFETARACAGAKAALSLHLGREEGHLIPLVDDNFSVEEQGKIAGEMSGKIPKEDFPLGVVFMYQRFSEEDRVGMMRVWEKAMPPDVLNKAVALVRKTIGEGKYQKIRDYLPDLPA